jgi:BirA family biotin operon repressor/biotin-[acetyl-CoA-carboxylase] ligase
MADQSDTPPPEVFEAIRQRRPHLGPLGSRLLYFPTTSSTNDVAAALCAQPDAEGTVVCADAQTAGRGRRGRQWFSPAMSGLYVSVILAPGRAKFPDRATALLTLAAGVGLSEAVERNTGLGTDIKWPNDLCVGRRKVAGILAEAAGGRVVLGYGLNVYATACPPDLADRATSLEGELGRPIDRAALLADTLAGIAARYDDLLEGRFDAILDAWRKRAPGSHGARVVVQTPAGPAKGITAGVDECGALLVRADGRIERIVAGEVTWL